MQSFTVVIPCFNAAATLPATLASIMAQSHPAADIICVDDGSTDATRAMVATLYAGDPRVRLVRNPCKGPSAARNVGAAQAPDDSVIAFCDADDLWAPGKLAELATAFADHTVDAAYGRIAFFRDTPADAVTLSTVPQEPLTIPMLLGENPVCTMSNIAIRATAYRMSGGLDPAIVHNEDLEWLIRVAGGGARIVGIDRCQTWYRTSDTGLSADLEAMARGRTAALQTAARFGYHPDRAAEAIHQRYLARRSLRLGQGRLAPLRYTLRGLRCSPAGFFSVPRRGLLTAVAACAAVVLPRLLTRRFLAR